MSAELAARSQDSSLAVRAEAAAWIARLHGPDRTEADEASFKRWLATDPAHAAAFEHMTELWEMGSLLGSALTRLRPAPSAPRFSLRNSAVAAALALVVGATALLVMRDPSESTRIGEQRILTLEDGSHVTLNTATRITVRYDERQRRVELNAGEALFDIAKRADRPFVVDVGDRRVTALGTSFVARQEPGSTSIFLVDGKVAITPANDERAATEHQDFRVSRGVVLMPGQRVTFAPARPPAFDRPSADRVIAWRQGLVVLDELPLADALTEMNRYSSLRLTTDTPGTRIRVSGVFHAGDSEEFAQALVQIHGVRARREARSIVISDRSD
jgi:transmembrane sensor